MVVPSLVYETFGYVVLEAFAEGTPVLVRNLGALPELVIESQGGIVVPDAPYELADAITRVVRDPVLQKSLGANGLAAREGIWSESKHLDRYFSLIEHYRRDGRVRTDAPHGRNNSSTPRQPVACRNDLASVANIDAMTP